MTLSINDIQHKRPSAKQKCRDFLIVMLNVIMLSDVMLGVVVLSVVMS